METYLNKRRMKKLALGIVIITFGSLMLGLNLGFIDSSIRYIVYSWQMLLIAIGFVHLFDKEKYTTGLILIAIGGVFLLRKMEVYDASVFKVLLPVLVIAVGLLIIFKKNIFKPHSKLKEKFKKANVFDAEFVDEDKMDEINIFGGSKKKIHSKNFKGGDIISIFGGSEINLLDAELSDGINTIECVAIFGGIVLIVPSDWTVKTEMVSIFGGFNDKRYKLETPNGDKLLIIKGVALFGGGEIKN